MNNLRKHIIHSVAKVMQETGITPGDVLTNPHFERGLALAMAEELNENAEAVRDFQINAFNQIFITMEFDYEWISRLWDVLQQQAKKTPKMKLGDIQSFEGKPLTWKYQSINKELELTSVVDMVKNRAGTFIL